ncbi:MAG: 5-formyltetrahydrofolate cyclo-ligase [Microthrixaceae bacterium]|nr:5-formyltetrahydrofolate cyclo-ligase [Microthrixaceae bacterium]
MTRTDPAGDPRGERTAIRTQMRGLRRGIDSTTRSEAEASACSHLVDTLESMHRSTGERRLGIYLPVDGEISPLPAIGDLAGAGWSTWLPVIGNSESMCFRLWSEGDDLSKNEFGIGEPLPQQPELDASSLTAVVVPCVAVDPYGTRVGMGAGYYDRALANEDASQSEPLLIGFAFEFQLVPRIESAAWDIPMQLIITDKITRTTRAGGA